MSPVVLYLHPLKATATTFPALASTPVLHADLGQHHDVLTDRQINVSIVVTRSTPGPAGLYIVSVGYFVAGVWGIAGWAAMIPQQSPPDDPPAIAAVGLVRFREQTSTRRSVLLVIVSAAILLSAKLV